MTFPVYIGSTRTIHLQRTGAATYFKIIRISPVVTLYIVISLRRILPVIKGHFWCHIHVRDETDVVVLWMCGKVCARDLLEELRWDVDMS